MIKADFHIHTTASDGRITPAAILRLAAAAGLTHIAITDHDTVDGLLALEEVEAPAELSVLNGIEFSTDRADCEIHILGYGLDIHHSGLRRRLAVLQEARLTRIGRMAAAVTALGYPVSEQEVMAAAAGAAAVGRPHLAGVLVAKGYFVSVSDVFARLLGKGKPGYIPHYRLAAREVVDSIHEAGGIAVLAHPGLVGDDRQVAAVVALGLDGIEVYHPRHDGAAVPRYLELAGKRGLLITGGSDYHAIPGRFPERLGEFMVPDAVAALVIKRLSPHSPAGSCCMRRE